jgi:transcriptional regulator with XRE-family HTH domain
MKVLTEVWRGCRVELDLSSDEAAKLLKISGGYLRHIEAGTQEPSARLVHRAARLYGKGFRDLVQTNDGVPDQPPQQPKNEPKAPPKREETAGTGPARVTDRAS